MKVDLPCLAPIRLKVVATLCISPLAVGLMVMLMSIHPSEAQTGESMRLAIVGTDETAAIEAILTASLSNQPGLELLDRANLGLLENERSLDTVGAKAKAAGANALAFLEFIPGPSQRLISLRIVETTHGQVLQHLFLPEGDDLPGMAETLGSQISEKSREAASPDFADKTPVALLGLRFELSRPENPAREYALNQLIASQLHQQSSLRVLERWQSEALLFERVAKAETSDLAGGALLIDGLIKENAESWTVHLRLRAPGSETVRKLDISQPEGDLNGLATAVVAGFMKDAGKTPVAATDRRVEALLFNKLTTWALINGLGEEAVAAAETAAALSPDNAELTLQRALAHSFHAWPRPLAETESFSYDERHAQDFDPVPRLHTAQLAMELLQDFDRLTGLNSSQSTPDQRGSHESTMLRITHDAICVIRRTLDTSDKPIEAAEISVLRGLIKDRIGKLSQSTILETRLDLVLSFNTWTSTYASTIPEAREELLKLHSLDIGSFNDAAIWAFVSGVDGEFVTPADANITITLTRGKLLPAPRTADSDRAAWLQEADHLIGDSLLKHRIVGHVIRVNLLRKDSDAFYAAIKDFGTLIWNERQALTETAPFLLESAKVVFVELSQSNAPDNLKSFNHRFLSSILSGSGKVEPKTFSFFAEPQIRWSPSDAARLLKTLESHRDRIVSSAREPDYAKRTLQALTSTLQASAGEATGPKTSLTSRPTGSTRSSGTDPSSGKRSDSLLLKTFIEPVVQFDPSKIARLDYSSPVIDSNFDIWLLDFRYIYRGNPESTTPAKSIEVPSTETRQGESYFALTGDHILISLTNGVWLGNKSDPESSWEKIDVPDKIYKVIASGALFFLVYEPQPHLNDHDSGVISVNPATRDIEVLTSNRREAAPDNLDGRSDWIPTFAFQYGDGIVVAGHPPELFPRQHHLYIKKAGSESWTRLLDSSALIYSCGITASGDALITFGGGTRNIDQAVLFPLDGGKPQLLLGWENPPPQTPYYNNEPVVEGKAMFVLPETFPSPPVNFEQRTAVLYHDNKLYLTTNNVSFSHFSGGPKIAPDAQLLHILHADGTSQSIPLQFELDKNSSEYQRIPKDHGEGLLKPSVGEGFLFASENSLYLGCVPAFKHSIAGYWQVALAELDAFPRQAAAGKSR